MKEELKKARLGMDQVKCLIQILNYDIGHHIDRLVQKKNLLRNGEVQSWNTIKKRIRFRKQILEVLENIKQKKEIK